MTDSWDSDDSVEPDGGPNLDALSAHLGGDTETGSIDDALPEISFVSSDPAGITTLTASIDGEIQRIDLAPKACELTEAELARQILAVAEIVTLKASAGLNELVTGLMLLQGQDRDSVRDLVEHQMRLPTMELASFAEASLTARLLRDEL